VAAATPGVARAAAPVTSSVLVSASQQAVRAFLAEHTRTLGLCPDVRSVRVLSTQADGCAQLEVETTGLWSPMRYVSLRCPTADGSREDLLRSEDFLENSFEWSVVDTGAARRVTLAVRSSPRLPVPDWVLQAAVRRSVDATLANLVARLDAPASP